jgi:hypothetical protein
VEVEIRQGWRGRGVEVGMEEIEGCRDREVGMER